MANFSSEDADQTRLIGGRGSPIDRRAAQRGARGRRERARNGLTVRGATARFRKACACSGASAALRPRAAPSREVAEDLEPVASGEPGQFDNALRDEGHSLIRADLPSGSSGCNRRSRPEAARFRPPPDLVKKPTSKFAYCDKNRPFPTATLGRISCLFRYKVVPSNPTINICRFDRGRLTTHVRFPRVGRESRGTGLHIFP